MDTQYMVSLHQRVNRMRQHVLVVEPVDESQHQAEQLWMQRKVLAPEAWRSRAASAGGLLGAAAAASLAGLFSRFDSMQGCARPIAAAAAGAYVIAVAALLLASVWRSPARSDDGPTEDAIGWINAYVADEARPIRRLVIVGAASGVAAVVATASTAGLVLFKLPPSRMARIAISDPLEWKAIESACPKFTNPSTARTRTLPKGRVELLLQPGVCGSRSVSFTVPESSVVVVAEKQ